MGKSGFILYPYGDPYLSQNLMGSELDQILSPDYSRKIQAAVFT